MLATLLRRTKRFADARLQLAELERIESASKWRAEIELEKRLLKELSDTIEDQTQPEESLEPAEALTSVSQAA
jgi:hypothetical protein